MEAETHTQLYALELRLLDPEFRKSPEAGAHQADDFVEVSSGGRVLGRAEVLAALASEQRRRFEVGDFACDNISGTAPSSPIVASEATTDGPARRARRSSIWQLGGESPRLRFHQSTPILE